MILKGQSDAALAIMADHFQAHGASSAIDHGVAGQLARGRDDLSLVDELHAFLDSPVPYLLAHANHILARAHWDGLRLDYQFILHFPRGPAMPAAYPCLSPRSGRYARPVEKGPTPPA